MRRAWSPGVRARLLFAFFGIAAFAVLAAVAGMYAFREVGDRLDVIETRVPPTLSALELSRSAERIIAVAPALLAAPDRMRRDQVKATLAEEMERLNGRLRELKSERAQALPVQKIESLVFSLTRSLDELDSFVVRRLEANERIAALRRNLFWINDETQRLLAPWLEVVGRQIAALVEPRQAESAALAAQPEKLASLIDSQRSIRIAQAQVSAVADMLADASTTQQPRRLSVLAFQLGLALRGLDTTAAALDPKLRPLFHEQVAKFRALSEGLEAIAEARKQELVLVKDGQSLLSETEKLSAQLTIAIDQLGNAAKQDISDAIRDALSVQHVGTRVLIGLVALSVLSSILIVWLYVGGNVVRRLAALSEGMLAIAGGRLQTPVAVKGSDEIAAMGRAVEIFRQNTLERDELLAERAQAAEQLEREVRQRTQELTQAFDEIQDKSRQLEIANKYKSHFLASASHDLRQPLHALNLFVEQLRTESDPDERRRLVGRIGAAVSSMNELFEAMLDMSRLDAGILRPEWTEFPIEDLLRRMETTFADAAEEKGLRLSVVPCSAWVRSDFVLLERILLNLVSNAIRYTAFGGVLVGSRHRGEQLRIDVCDTGPGIPEEQRQSIFNEFYQLAVSDRRGGLGLGLAIVDRLGRLLGHEVELASRSGRGSRFSVSVPLMAARHRTAEAALTSTIADPVRDKLVLVMDDDPLVLDGMGGILRSWGSHVLAADTETAALSKISWEKRPPDLIIADYRLSDGRTGIQAIDRLRKELGLTIPAFLISGDTAPERLRAASERGYPLLHKPVSPMRLRAMINQLLKTPEPREIAPAAK